MWSLKGEASTVNDGEQGHILDSEVVEIGAKNILRQDVGFVAIEALVNSRLKRSRCD